jgi:DNA-binding transcriptional ArsR family regulator
MMILALLYSHEDEEYYFSEIGRALGKPPGVFQRGINSLDEQGIIQSRKKGNQRLFRINKENILFKELKSIVERTCGAEFMLRDLVNKIKEIELALIFGSYANNTMQINSDIDLILVTKSANIEDSLLESITAIEKKLLREINYSIYTQKEFYQKLKANDPFIEEVLSNKYLLLKGKL